VAESTGAFQIILAATIVYFCIYFALTQAMTMVNPNSNAQNIDPNYVYIVPGTAFWVLAFIRDLLHYVFFFGTVLILRNVRKSVRAKYAIPITVAACGECEDCCCSLFCPCFVAAQMLRHTTDYDTYPATCCTERGIPKHAPAIV
jgi:PLAC8 family